MIDNSDAYQATDINALLHRNDDLATAHATALRCINYEIESLRDVEIALSKGKVELAQALVNQCLQRLLTCRNAIK